jgi:thiosulfate/3-mercaptopyruvate sulfurtransferase
MSAPVFVSVDELAARIDDGQSIRILEARRDDQPVVGHLPGAVAVSLTIDLADPDAPATEGKRPLPRIEALQAAVRRWGLTAENSVVVYDHDNDFVAARAWWVLRWAGVDHVSILDGGVRAWAAAGHRLGALAGTVPEGDIVLRPGQLPELDADAAEKLGRTGRLLDARGADAFVAGHIPGAGNVSSRDTLTAQGTLRPDDELRELYGVSGHHAAAPGLYCGGGVAGAHAAAVLAHLGLQAPLYVGSFSAWSADPRRPVATGVGST